jgi:hypothetical protein
LQDQSISGKFDVTHRDQPCPVSRPGWLATSGAFLLNWAAINPEDTITSYLQNDL